MSEHELILKEKYSQYWPFVAMLSGVCTVLFMIGFFLVSDILIEGYLRLAAFGFFALCVLSLYKLKDGQIEIHFSVENGSTPLLHMSYYLRGNEIHSESQELMDVKDLKTSDVPNRSFYNDLVKGDKAVRFKKGEMDGWLYMNEIYGRVIPLTQENTELITEFITSAQNRFG